MCCSVVALMINVQASRRFAIISFRFETPPTALAERSLLLAGAVFRSRRRGSCRALFQLTKLSLCVFSHHPFRFPIMPDTQQLQEYARARGVRMMVEIDG